MLHVVSLERKQVHGPVAARCRIRPVLEGNGSGCARNNSVLRGAFKCSGVVVVVDVVRNVQSCHRGRRNWLLRWPGMEQRVSGWAWKLRA